MKLRFKHALLFLSFYSNAYAECKNPFEGISGRFILQEKLDCTAVKERVTLRIGNASEMHSFKDIGPTSYFLTPECTGQTKGINLNYNSQENFIVYWSQTPPGLNGVFRINPTCGGAPIAVLDTTERTILNGTILAAYYTYPPFITYVKEGEDLANEVTLRATNGTVLAHAKKTFVSGPICYATWDVNYTNVDPAVISYILAWKDSSNLNCSIPAPTAPSITPGTAAILTTVGIVGTAAIVAGLVAYRFRSEIGNFQWAYNRIQD